MTRAIKDYCHFLRGCSRLAWEGDWRYYLWTGLLFAVSLLGLNAYAKQLVHGLAVTGMSDQVSWGVYIANFTFLGGIAAAAATLVIPVYIYKNEEMKDIVILGELLSVAAMIMCLLFVTVDLGRPERFWHLVPWIGKLNFPNSMLSWDVIVLNGYLALNVYICGYMLYSRYQGKPPAKWFLIPFVFVSIVWAVAVLAVEAFLYLGLGGRPFWNSAIMGPRFIAASFTAGPALIILALQTIRRVTATKPAGDKEIIDSRGPAPGRDATLHDMEVLGRHLPELASVGTQLRESCLIGATVVEAAPGEAILRQGAKDNEAYFVLEGRVVVKREENGRFRTIRTVGPGEQFGEISALNGTPRTATAIAEGAARVLRLPSSSLRRLMKKPEMERVIRERMTERLMITDRALLTLRGIVQVAMLVNVFLLLNEFFKEFYSDSLHVAASRYLYFGLHGHHALVPWIWTAVVCNLVAMVILVLPASRSLKWLDLACVLAIVGIWIEKCMGLVIPGFVPSPLGEIVEYSPTLNETLICFGIWAFGLLCYTVFLRVAVPILQGRFTKPA